MMKFFLGTTNPSKVRELAAILVSSGCSLEVTDPVDPDETEADFEGNALLKAKCYAAHSGGITVSEDSGLVIPSLHGLPGSYSARFSDCEIDWATRTVSRYLPSNKTREEMDELNNDLVLRLMTGIPEGQRQASFVIVLAVAAPDGEILFSSKGECFGTIAQEKRGKKGFGYDPIFIADGCHGRTNAELDSMRKNLRSHRKVVLDAFQQWLKSYLAK